MIDSDGYRANVGIILANGQGQLFWARRAGMDAWQFPQGGIRKNESVECAMYRELREETGLNPQDVIILSYIEGWLRYRLPKRYIRKRTSRVCIGQKQKWFLLQLLDESKIQLDVAERPEFDHWRWIDFWQPAREVVEFKQQVYKKALQHFEPILFPE
ncbi:MAG: NUDIX hydrolase [Gammaproteobacteria bacterium]|nr:NUDIX hydrolase [Gammaproteobacteria bacterium]